jgi:hypothetical protein
VIAGPIAKLCAREQRVFVFAAVDIYVELRRPGILLCRMDWVEARIEFVMYPCWL